MIFKQIPHPLGVGSFISFGELTVIIESDIPIYNLKWFIDRVRKLDKCPKCSQYFEEVDRNTKTIVNGKEERCFPLYFCPTCSKGGPKSLKITILKGGEKFDVYEAYKKLHP